MASHSPQRARRPQAQVSNTGSIQLRETSPSPTLRDQRPRAIKTQSMPLVPSVPNFPPQPPQPGQNPQSSPGLPSNGGRWSPPTNSVPVRLLPTPPHNNPPTFESERRLTPPPGPQQTMSTPNVNQHFGRSAPRAVGQTYPSRLQNFEENWQMTPEFMAEIANAADQQAQYQSSLPLAYPSAPQSESPPVPKGPNVERVRATGERSSPINAETTQQRGRRDQQILRESPKNRDRHPASPIGSNFDPTLSPESRQSPAQHLEPQPHPSSYPNHYNAREPAPVTRRAPASEPRMNGQASSQTSQPQTVAARNPDRSLPVQEEDENGGHRNEWPDNDTMVESNFSSSSPTPSSDLNPDGNNQRFDSSSQTSVHDEDENEKVIQEDRSQYNNRDSTEEDSGTPKSPTVPLPRDNNDAYYPGANIPIRGPVQPVPLRPNGRSGPTDHIMRGLESTLMDSKQLQASQSSSSLPNGQPQQPQPQVGQKFFDPRQQFAPQAQQYPKYPVNGEYGYAQAPLRDRNGVYMPPQPQVYPDDFYNYDDSTSSYIASYLPSPRPDAPEPPTPQSQTAAPSPSPFQYNGVGGPKPTGTPGYRAPTRPAGSPYPFPFNHVRRNRQNQNSRLIANGLDPAIIQEQIARQWQIFAQNNQGNITDSTFSPSSTPYPPDDLFNHWAYIHTRRMMRGMHETASIHSSPSHQPIDLPAAPPHFLGKKRGSKGQSYSRKPPPRVESTQPRDTSPELSSGEETAGDERANRTATPDTVPSATPTDVDAPSGTEIPIENLVVDDTSGDGEWVDEDDEDDYDDLIDLEYHPSFIKNVSKRRRKWEVGWENLIQAFQTLDRQTDATMVLLASPSHSTKLHALQSRSIRRTHLHNSGSMKNMRADFARISDQRRQLRPTRTSLVDRLESVSGTSIGEGSDGSSASVEENLRRALEVALGSLGTLGEVYEQREARVLEELQRSREERERVELLLRQVLGDKNPLSSPVAFFGP